MDFIGNKQAKKYLLIAGAAFLGFLWSGQAWAFQIGERQNFFVDENYDALGRQQVAATLQQVGDHALFYVADDWWSSLGSIDKEDANKAILELLAEFDKTIYPRLTKIYGSEWSPGVDNDLRITIFITQMNKSTGGYFNSLDEYPRSQVAISNAREMLYLNSLYLITSSAKIFLAHEFQHMINFYQKDKLRNSIEDIWLNEARSEYAATLCGYDTTYAGSNLERRVKDFLRAPGDSLTEWQNEATDYGAANLFMQYFVSRYGEQILSKMMATEAVGIASIDQALAAGGFTEKFSDVFANWLVANFVNDCQFGQGQRYCYLNPQLTYEIFHLRPLMVNLLPVEKGNEFSFSDAIKDWAGRWYEILPIGSGLNMEIDFQGEPAANFQVAMVIYNADGSKNIRFFKLNSLQSAAELVAGFGSSISDVVLIIFNRSKQTNFSANDPAYQFSYDATITSADQIVQPSPAPTPEPNNPAPPTPISAVSPAFPDGSLLRAKGDARVYIIKGQYRRWLQTPQILLTYPHLSWQNVIEVTPEQLNWYKEAWFIRADGDSRVYEINGDGTKHWLNMSAAAFASSGRSWEMVYIVNARERDLYRTGADVLK